MRKEKKKSHADDHTTVYSDVHSSIKTLQDTLCRLLRTNRHSFQTDSIFSAAFAIVIYHSSIFCLVVHLQQTAKTAIIKSVPLINWPSDKFDSSTFDLGRTLDSCGFFPEEFPALFPSTAGEFQTDGVHTTWGRTWTPAAKPQPSAGSTCHCPYNSSKVEIAQLRKRQLLVRGNGSRHKSDQAEREKSLRQQEPKTFKMSCNFTR